MFSCRFDTRLFDIASHLGPLQSHCAEISAISARARETVSEIHIYPRCNKPGNQDYPLNLSATVGGGGHHPHPRYYQNDLCGGGVISAAPPRPCHDFHMTAPTQMNNNNTPPPSPPQHHHHDLLYFSQKGMIPHRD